jgi:quercetin dioxygenase-like cupin family protein
MNDAYIYHRDLRVHAPLPPDGILSRTLQNDDRSKVVQFIFAPGQELSAHTAPFPAILYFASGSADLKLGPDTQEAGEGTFVYMTPQLVHGVKAKTLVVMLLIMLKNPPAK